MSSAPSTSREFRPGTLGWTASDLDDPAIARAWDAGRFEIINGVLTDMAAAYYEHGSVLQNLVFVLHDYFRRAGVVDGWSTEVDIILDELRVIRADAVMMTPQDRARQLEEVKRRGRPDPERSRVYVPPTLVIESVSPDHTAHDLITKRKWYAEFGVPNYWIIDGYDRSLLCLRLQGGAGGEYVTDAEGRKDASLNPSVFAGLEIKLASLW